VTIFEQSLDADPSFLQGATIGVIGFGNQGAAQAACLRDEGLDVLVFLRDSNARSASANAARARGFAIAKPSDLERCRILAVLAPDETHPDILENLVRPHARAGALAVFAHGFALREGASPRADLDVALVVPLGPGALLRERYLNGRGLPGLLAVVRDATGQARNAALAYASRLRMTRAGLLSTTLDEEVVSDLFSEQAVLVGGAVELMRAAWETLVEGGISPEIAYYSCVNELQQILDLVVREGPAGMRRRISSTARYGGLTRGPRIIGPASRQALKQIFEEIQSGKFSAEWKEEQSRGAPLLEKLLREEAQHPLEESGERIRRMPVGDVDSPQENS
jgi:ketol-acid reductoisomerase